MLTLPTYVDVCDSSHRLLVNCDRKIEEAEKVKKERFNKADIPNKNKVNYCTISKKKLAIKVIAVFGSVFILFTVMKIISPYIKQYNINDVSISQNNNYILQIRKNIIQSMLFTAAKQWSALKNSVANY